MQTSGASYSGDSTIFFFQIHYSCRIQTLRKMRDNGPKLKDAPLFAILKITGNLQQLRNLVLFVTEQLLILV